MNLCHLMVFPLKASLFLKLNPDKNHLPINIIIYQCLIEKLIYIAYGTRPDIAFMVRQLSCHNSNPQNKLSDTLRE